MTEQKKTRAIIITIIIILSMISFVPLTQSKNNAAIVYVDEGRDASWYNATKVRTISEGVNNVTAGGTIYVYEGDYLENVVINKTVSIIGNSSEDVCLEPASTGSQTKTIDVRANNTNISNMFITGAYFNIHCKTHNNLKIENCEIDEASEYAFYVSCLDGGYFTVLNTSISTGGSYIDVYGLNNLYFINSTFYIDRGQIEVMADDMFIASCMFDASSYTSFSGVSIQMVSNRLVSRYGEVETFPQNYFEFTDDMHVENNIFNETNLYLYVNNADYVVSNNTFTNAGVSFYASDVPSSFTMNNNTNNGTQILFVQNTPSYTFENNHSSVQIIFLNVDDVVIDNISFLDNSSELNMITTALCENVSISNISESAFNLRGLHNSIFDKNISIRNINITRKTEAENTGIFSFYCDKSLGFTRYMLDNVSFTGGAGQSYGLVSSEGSVLTEIYFTNISVHNASPMIDFNDFPVHSLYFDNVTTFEQYNTCFLNLGGRASNITIKNVQCYKFLSFIEHDAEANEFINNTYVKNVTLYYLDVGPTIEGRFKNLHIEDLTFISDGTEENFFNLLDNSSNITIKDSNITIPFGEDLDNIFLELETWTDNVSLENVTVIGFDYGFCCSDVILENFSVNNSLIHTTYDMFEMGTREGRDFSFTNNTFRCYSTETLVFNIEGYSLENGHVLYFYINNFNVKNNTFITTDELLGSCFFAVDGINFSNNNLSQGHNFSITFTHVENATINDNHIEGALLFFYVNNVTASNNKIIYCETGITIYDGRDVVIENETLISSDTDGDEVGIEASYSDYITISDCNISGIHEYGISIESSNKTTVNDNLMLLQADPEAPLGGCCGVSIQGTAEPIESHHLIYGNNITFSESAEPSCGVAVLEEENVTIRNNEINYASDVAVVIYSSSYTYILNNTIRGTNTVLSDEHGVIIVTFGGPPASYHTVGFNNITGIDTGVYVSDEDEVIIRNNFIDGIDCSIELITTSIINITNNQIKNSYYGIYMEEAETGTIHTNFITGNHIGLFIDEADDYLIYNNYFNNSYNVCNNSVVGINTWNVSKTPGQSIVGGPYLGGNYWSDYAGSDADGDGLGDTPYGITPCML